jgi:hypothetical protein
MSSRDTVQRIPALGPAYRFLRSARIALRAIGSPFVDTYPPGHFYSPLPDANDIPAGVDDRNRECPGVDLRDDAQLALLHKMAGYYAEMPFTTAATPDRRYYFANEWYSYCDATVLYGMLRHFRPACVIEIGSGFSSAVMLDTRDRFLHPSTQFTFIDPFPARLQTLVRPDDSSRCNVVVKKVQDVEISTFDTLRANDILLIDSSHVVKLGSDVAHLIFNVMPRLSSGVIIHFHDIPWPFEYPLTWLRAGRAWNEAYFVRAFLQFNDAFEILFFNDYMKTFYAGELRNLMPTCVEESDYPLTRAASSFWIVKR